MEGSDHVKFRYKQDITRFFFFIDLEHIVFVQYDRIDFYNIEQNNVIKSIPRHVPDCASWSLLACRTKLLMTTYNEVWVVDLNTNTYTPAPKLRACATNENMFKLGLWRHVHHSLYIYENYQGVVHQLIDITTKKKLCVFQQSEHCEKTLWTDHRALVVFARIDTRLLMQYSITDGTLQKTADGCCDNKHGCYISSAGEFLGNSAILYAGNKMEIWDMIELKPIEKITTFYRITDAKVCPNNAVIATLHWNGDVILQFWDLDTFTPITHVKPNSMARKFFIHPDGVHIIIRTLDFAEVWKLPPECQAVEENDITTCKGALN
tara:strand:+ start:1295 stop:2257 length:963 start_codon:yes stop_codon:yes gene_type:complete